MWVGPRNTRTSCDSTNFPHTLQKRWNRIAGAGSDWWWIVDSLLDSQNKASSSVWKMKYNPSLRKFKMECSAKKVILTAFCDCQGLIYTEFNDNNERDVIWYSTAHAKCNRGVKTSAALAVFLLRNNASPHHTKRIKNLITDLKWEEFTHPLYSLDLAVSDYHLFPQPNKELQGIFQHEGRINSTGKFDMQKLREDLLRSDWKASYSVPEVPWLKRWICRKIVWNVASY